MELVKLLTEEVESQVAELGQMTLGSEEYESTVDGTTKLTGKIVDLKKVEAELKKIEYEHEEKVKAQEIELKKAEVDRKDQKIKNGINIAGIVVPVGAAIWATVYTWIKEQDGVQTYTAGKRATDVLLRFMKK